ncbi:MAG: hypothetical protein M0030_26970 [Actinomycetota bacterium]|nr:hypothetical protein [Actinomycetota bacterium]
MNSRQLEQLARLQMSEVAARGGPATRPAAGSRRPPRTGRIRHHAGWTLIQLGLRIAEPAGR